MPLSFPLIILIALSVTCASTLTPRPSAEAARQNGFHIFNAIHSAMRQWGSSINHNGMSVFRGTIPQGTLLSHGSPTSEIPQSFEWLAFEIEHAENFARVIPNEPPPYYDKPPGGHGPGDPDQQAVLAAAGATEITGGYLHTYQTTRDLHILYVDGTSAGKTNLGTVDMQDYILLGGRNLTDPHKPIFGDKARAEALCALAETHGLDGIVRMEIGFELIHCDFSSGLELISALRQPSFGERQHDNFVNLFEWSRAVAARYDGIGGYRVRLDFSSMVTAWFYSFNYTNPDPGRQDLPRLIGLSSSEREAILAHFEKVADLPSSSLGIDWQVSVVDMIVARFSDRLASLSREECGVDEFVSQVLVATNVFVMASAPDAVGEGETLLDDGIERCSAYYLRPATILRGVWTEEDELIAEAVNVVTTSICETFFHVRKLILDVDPYIGVSSSPHVAAAAAAAAAASVTNGLEHVLEEGKDMFRDLMERLQWTTRKRCRTCPATEVCFVAMFPFGTKEDHFFPRCQNWTELNEGSMFGPDKELYWIER